MADNDGYLLLLSYAPKEYVSTKYLRTGKKNLHKFPATITVFAKSDKSHLLLCFMNSSVSSGQKVVLYPWQEYLKVHPDFIMSVHIHLSSPTKTRQKHTSVSLVSVIQKIAYSILRNTNSSITNYYK